MRVINKLAAGIAAASIAIAGAPPAAHADEPPATEAAADTTAPTLVSFTGAPDTVAPGEPFTFEATASDDGAIANLAFTATLPLRHPGLSNPDYTAGPIVDNGDGTWTRSFGYAIPRDVPYGTYPLGTIGMADAAGNYTASSWTTPGPSITVDDPTHPVGELAVSGTRTTTSTVTAHLDAPGATVTHLWWGKSAIGLTTSSSSRTFTLPLGLAGSTVTLRATARWDDGTVRERTTTFVPGKGTLPLGPVTLGTVRVGTAASGGHTPVASILGNYTAATSTQKFQWLSGGQPVPGATAARYTPVPADRGKTLQLRVTTSTNLPFAQQTVVQHSPTRTVGYGTLTASTPRAAGSTWVGSTLSAVPGTWTKGTGFTYQWLREGQPIRWATRATYKTTAADHARRITVKVTGRLPGYAIRTTTSPAIKASLRKLTVPRIEPYGSWEPGNALAGRNYPLQKWTAGTRVTYQWLRDGKPIRGATSRTYVIKRTDIGHRIAVRHTGTKAGYLTASTTTGSVRI
ncbi:hypothetical protein [Arthrobacter sp. KK5.5]|uniref:hypothetical protein n=1 Tax=Arthrobacter sp. KK5.5 TaxID=3373084 RepID=UPI003EE71324